MGRGQKATPRGTQCVCLGQQEGGMFVADIPRGWAAESMGRASIRRCKLIELTGGV